MPTQIIDGFKLNAATPIDSRLVTTGTASRNSMTYKYEGLRVYDTVQKMPFVYINSAWVEESGSSTTSGGGSGTSMLLGGTENYIPKITSTGTINSIIREYVVNANDRRIGINVGTSQIDATLHVKGNSKFEGQVTATNFVGDISGVNVQWPVAVNKLDNPTSNGTYILKSINKQNQWVAETTGENIIVTKNTTDTSLYLVLSKDPVATTGNNLYVVNNTSSDLIAANAKTRQLMLGTGNVFSVPQYSFSGNTNTGMYGSDTDIGLTLLGSKRIYVDSNTVGIKVGSNTIAKFETGTMSITGATNITGNTTILGNTSISGTATINGGAAITGTTTINGNTTITAATTTITAATTTINATTETTIITPTLKINGSPGTMATLTGVLTIDGDAGLLVAKQVNLKKDESGQVLTVSASQSTSPPNMIINHCGTGLYVRGGTSSIGESLRLDSNAAYQNFISFYKNKEGVSTAHAANADRLGWIGYGSTLNSTLGFYNDSGDILIKAPTKTVTTQYGDLTYPRKITIESSSISLDGGVTTNGNLTVTSGKKLNLTGVELSALYSNNEFNFVNSSNFYTLEDKQIYINWRDLSQSSQIAPGSGITAYRFHNGQKDVNGLSNIIVGGIKIGSGTLIKKNVSGYIIFTRNSAGGGFSFSGSQKGGVLGVSDISPNSSSFGSSGSSGYILLEVSFANNTFVGGKDDNIVIANYGQDDTSGNVLYYGQHISGIVIDNNTLRFELRFRGFDAGGNNIRLNFIVQSI